MNVIKKKKNPRDIRLLHFYDLQHLMETQLLVIVGYKTLFIVTYNLGLQSLWP